MDYTATLFHSICLKPCRDRRPRRSEKKKRLLCVWLHTNSRLKSKICCFPDRRGRRSLQAKNPNRINTPLRSENLIVSGSSKAPVPTGKKSSRIDTPIRSGNSFASRVVEFSLRLVSQGDLPSANSRSDTTPWCHSLRSRRFATSPPTGKNSNRINTTIRSEKTIVSGPSKGYRRRSLHR